ncbi:hypothetical protein [Pseudomonas arsenicoxydans]
MSGSGSQEAQLRAATVSQEAVLTQQVVLPQAEQHLRDTQGQLSQGSVALIQSLGDAGKPSGTERLGCTMQYPGLRVIGYYTYVEPFLSIRG